MLGTTRTRQPGPSAAPPAGRSASTSGGVERFVAGAEGAGRSGGVSPGRVRRPRGPGRRHDRELAAGRIAAQLAAVRRHRRAPVAAGRELVAAVVLGRVHGRVRARERGALVRVVHGHEAAAGRDRHAQAGVFGRGEPGVVDEPHQSAPVHGEVVRGGQAADDDELVAAEARGDVHLARVVGEDAGHEADRLVAGSVPETVVDLLEGVDVHLDDAVPASQPLEHGELLGERGVQVPAVEQAGQRVRDGRVGELLDAAGELLAGDALELAEDLHPVPLPVDLEDRRLDVDGEALAVLALAGTPR